MHRISKVSIQPIYRDMIQSPRLQYYLYYISGRRKIHFTFPDKTELAEEYDLRNNELLGKSY